MPITVLAALPTAASVADVPGQAEAGEPVVVYTTHPVTLTYFTTSPVLHTKWYTAKPSAVAGPAHKLPVAVARAAPGGEAEGGRGSAGV